MNDEWYEDLGKKQVNLFESTFELNLKRSKWWFLLRLTASQWSSSKRRTLSEPIGSRGDSWLLIRRGVFLALSPTNGSATGRGLERRGVLTPPQMPWCISERAAPAAELTSCHWAEWGESAQEMEKETQRVFVVGRFSTREVEERGESDTHDWIKTASSSFSYFLQGSVDPPSLHPWTIS